MKRIMNLLRNAPALSLLSAAGLWMTAIAAAPAARPRRVVNSLGMVLVRIPPGEFMMGSARRDVDRILNVFPTRDRAWFEDESPPHRVRITRPFYMSRCEVTNGQFRKFRPGHSSRRFWKWNLDEDRQPVVWVSWKDAVAFCAWLSRKEGRYYVLPTEAEWEYACRAGTSSAFWWGDTVDAKRMNYADKSTRFACRDRTRSDGFPAAAPVGSFPENPFGLCDMLGNVWEWCADWYDRGYYAVSPSVDPTGPRQGLMRVCRGGAWNVFPPDARCAKRGAYLLQDGSPWIGFRIIWRPDLDHRFRAGELRSETRSSSRSTPR